MGKKKDIVFLCQFFHPEYISSAQLPYDTVRALQDDGYSVDVICGYPREYFEGGEVPVREDLDGIHVHRLKYIQLDRSGTLGRLVNYFSFTFMAFLNLFEMAKYRAVVVYSNPPVLPWVAWCARVLFGCKLIFVAYDLYPEIAVNSGAIRDGNLICRLMNYINRRVYGRADRVVALSSEMKEFIAGNRCLDPEKIVVIPNWYADKGERNPDRSENRWREMTKGRFVVSYFGNMGTIQDMQTILDTIRDMKDDGSVFFFIAGHGNKMEALKQAVEAEGLENARVFSFLHGQDYLDALQISDAALISLDRGMTRLCVPSKTYSYMMEGIPLVAIMEESDIVRDIEAGAGMWVRNGDDEGLVRCIRAMRDDPAKQESMRKTCREIFLQKYTMPICTQKYVEMFRDLLK